MCFTIFMLIMFIIMFIMFFIFSFVHGKQTGDWSAFASLIIPIFFIIVLCFLLGFDVPCRFSTCNIEGHYFEYMSHADDCQCNECVINACSVLNHGDTCQCDKCIECKNIGGN